jgi:D-tyrosyl-tRNA(Tyr) deacylase
MIAVLQRADSASVRVEGRTLGSIDRGLLILLGVGKGDTKRDAELLAAKIAACRIFEDDAGKMNLSLCDVGGGALVISNFTLLADYRKGNRPSFFDAAPPAEAKALYLDFVALLSQYVERVETGEFGADMRISLAANGPVTIVMDSEILKKGRGKNP